LGLPIGIDMSINHRNTRDNDSASNLNFAGRRIASEGHSQVMECQTSVPEPFRISQPNFYTEVNANTTQPTSNFTHTANIDEDYDT